MIPYKQHQGQKSSNALRRILVYGGICKSILNLLLIRAVELHHDDGYQKLIITISVFGVCIEGLEL